MSYWLRTPTGRLKAPKKKEIKGADYECPVTNVFGEPVTKPGDFVNYGANGVSAGTVGKVIAIDSKDYGTGNFTHWRVVERLDGTIEHYYPYFLSPIPYEAVQEVKDFYINDGRPERIKVKW